VASKIRASGQTCVSANRIFVQQDILPLFTERLKKKMETFNSGSGFDESTSAGPLINRAAIKKVLEHVNDATGKGAQLITGGEALQGNFMKPTILTGLKPSMRIAQEEIFGPVAALFPFKDEDEVLLLANSTAVGLGGYIYTKDINRVWRTVEKLDAGTIGINSGMVSDAAVPFGGIKESGFGKEGSKYGLEDYIVVKALTFGGIGL
jgi:succinate-semialdehyde dehydrogenase / glutarate-semialdehyde dehydrogenase